MTKAWNIPRYVTMLYELYSTYVGQMDREIDKIGCYSNCYNKIIYTNIILTGTRVVAGMIYCINAN